MRTQSGPFAHTCAEARARFLEAGNGARGESHPEPVRGLELETLAIDVARVGAGAPLHRHARLEAGRAQAVARGRGAGDRWIGRVAMMS
jgi:hypothetical protein